jgi:hypothetical protein
MIQIKVLIINRNQKKLFSFIESLRTDNSGGAPLKKEGQLVADTKQKANILNEQFKSVFTTESIDNIPNKGVSAHPDIPPLIITTPGIRKLLDNINPHKASGPDNISGRILKDLQNFTAPILTIIFSKITSDWLHTN